MPVRVEGGIDDGLVWHHGNPVAEARAMADGFATPEGRAAVAGGRGLGAGLKLLRHARPLMRGLLDAEWAAVRFFAPDVILHHPKCFGAPFMARALGCPHILASPLPGFTLTAAFASPLLPFASLGPMNRASHMLAIGGARLLFGRTLRAWREEALGPGNPGAGRAAGTLYAYSRHVVPVPPDWGEGHILSMKPGEERPLQENMTFHLLPWVQLPGYGAVGCPDTVLVTSDARADFGLPP